MAHAMPKSTSVRTFPRPPSSNANRWNADSGATIHMSPRLEWFKTYEPNDTPVRVASSSIIRAAGIGDIEFAPVIDGVVLPVVVLRNVLHVPELNQNLFSVLSVVARGEDYSVSIKTGKMTFLYKDEPYLNAIINSSNVAFLEGETVTQNAFAVSSGFISDDVDLWHHRLGHLSYDRLRQLQKLAENEKIRGIPSKLPPQAMKPSRSCSSYRQT